MVGKGASPLFCLGGHFVLPANPAQLMKLETRPLTASKVFAKTLVFLPSQQRKCIADNSELGGEYSLPSFLLLPLLPPSWPGSCCLSASGAFSVSWHPLHWHSPHSAPSRHAEGCSMTLGYIPSHSMVQPPPCKMRVKPPSIPRHCPKIQQ